MYCELEKQPITKCKKIFFKILKIYNIQIQEVDQLFKKS